MPLHLYKKILPSDFLKKIENKKKIKKILYSKPNQKKKKKKKAVLVSIIYNGAINPI